MTSQRLTWMLTLAVTLAGAGVGCGDDKPSADASATGGRGGTGGATSTGGRGGTGGSGGRGGTGGTAGTGTGGSAAGDAASTGGTAGTGTGGTAGAGTGGTAGAGTGGTGGGTDAAADVATPVDMPVDQPLPVDLPPDTQAASTVMVNDCAQFMCPQLTSIASQCQTADEDCVHSKPSGTQINYCHSNGVKKVAKTTSSGGSGYTTTLEVFKANSGDDCYSIVIQGTGAGATDMQNWTYKSPTGTTLATATWRASDGRLVIRCDNVDYVIGDVGCPGTDGQPDDNNATECPAGTCSEP